MDIDKKRIIAVVLFSLGAFFILGAEANLTGAYSGVPFSLKSNSIIGVSLILLSIILLSSGKGAYNLEGKVEVSDVGMRRLFRKWLEKKGIELAPWAVYNEFDYLESMYNTEKKHEALDKKYESNQLKYMVDKENMILHQEDENMDKLANVLKDKKAYKNEAEEYLANRRVETRTKRLISLAKRCGYSLDPAKEGTNVKKGSHIITVIPKHGQIKMPTARRIIYSLASGKSSFRQ